MLKAFPQAEITTQVDAKRQNILDSWPEEVNDSAARRDWDFALRDDLEALSRSICSRTSANATRFPVNRPRLRRFWRRGFLGQDFVHRQPQGPQLVPQRLPIEPEQLARLNLMAVRVAENPAK